jgi:acetolactate synthase-1/2/3 large subunit
MTLALGNDKTVSPYELEHKSAGHVIVDTLVAHGIKRAHVVPGESFLDVLDGLHGSPIETIVCRHEGGATYMAEADGKMNQMPGVAMVTRGPGAANAHVGLHTAWQDSTPMVLFVGLIPFAHRDREAFQEFDIKAWFDTGAKRVMVLDHAERASEIVAEALFAAMNGRPGPVVIGLPEDVIRQQIPAELHPPIPVATGGMTTVDSDALATALASSSKPLFVTGGNDWTQEGADQFTAWLEKHHIPAAAEWRTQGTVPFDSPSYVGPIGYGRPRPTYDLLEETDLLIFVGTVPGDVITDGFLCRQDWSKKNFLVTIDPSLRGRSGPVSYQIVAKPDVFIRDLAKIELPVKDEWKAWTARMRGEQESFATLPSATPKPGPARMDVMDNQEYGTIRTHQERHSGLATPFAHRPAASTGNGGTRPTAARSTSTTPPPGRSSPPWLRPPARTPSPRGGARRGRRRAGILGADRTAGAGRDPAPRL